MSGQNISTSMLLNTYWQGLDYNNLSMDNTCDDKDVTEEVNKNNNHLGSRKTT